MRIRSVFTRFALLLAMLLALAQLGNFIVWRNFVIAPGARQMAYGLATQVQTLEQALSVVPPEEQAQILNTAQAHGLRLQTSAPTADTELEIYFLRQLSAGLRQRLGETTQVIFQRQPQPMVWLRAPQGQFWLGMPLDELQSGLPPLVLLALMLIALLTFIGASLLVWPLTGPLAKLATAAAGLGRGDYQPVHINGPQELQTLAATFNQAAAERAQAEQERDLLLASISHDLRTPLARLELAVELLHGDSDLKHGIQQDLHECDAIIGQFIALARAEHEQPYTKVDLLDLLQCSIEHAQRLELPIAAQLQPCTCYGHPLALRRVLDNLLENARRYGAPPLQLRLQPQGQQCCIELRDHGPGIASGAEQWLLQPFTRQDPARSHLGSGLGLAIVARIMRVHAGTVSLSNHPDGGLQVTLHLPLAL